MTKSYYLYILASKPNGTLYIGVTNDLIRRVYEHKSGKVDGFTKRYGVTQLVWYGETPDIEAAIHREKTMKRWPREWKINIIEGNNPDWRDLYPELIGAKNLMDPGINPG